MITPTLARRTIATNPVLAGSATAAVPLPMRIPAYHTTNLVIRNPDAAMMVILTEATAMVPAMWKIRQAPAIRLTRRPVIMSVTADVITRPCHVADRKGIAATGPAMSTAVLVADGWRAAKADRDIPPASAPLAACIATRKPDLAAAMMALPQVMVAMRVVPTGNPA